MGHPDIGAVRQILDGVHYPCGRGDLVRFAAACGADDDLLGHLSALPEANYEGIEAVHAALQDSNR